MGFRGKNRSKKGNQSKSKQRKPQKQRKTYSLYGNNKQNKFKGKRKAEDDFKEEKRQKIDEIPRVQPEASSSDSEEEIENHLKLLRDGFGSNTKKFVAIESSDDSDDDKDSAIVKKSLDEDSDCNSNEEIVEDKSDVENACDDEEDISCNNQVTNDKEKDSHEAEIAEEDEIDVDTQKEDEQADNANDPFSKRLFYELSESILTSLQSVPIAAETYNANWSELGRINIQIPKCEVKEDAKKSVSIAEEKPNAAAGTVPICINPMKETKLVDLYIKSQISDNIRKANKSMDLEEFKDMGLKLPFTPLQSEIFSILNNYQDLYFTQRTFNNADQIRFVYCLHIVNHILKTRTKVLHHNARLSRKDDVPEEFRDQGLVRPKILVIVPFKNTAYKIIQMLIDILISEDKGNVVHKNRFVEDYTGNEIAMPKKNPKPEDYEQLFTGNTSDDFKMGITVTKKSLKLYAEFYSADIIIASPLGLRFVIGAEGEPERDYDFLASIELLIMDQTEIFLMQNWDHLLHIFKHMHMQPKESHGTDFSRVRTWCLNGWAKYYRQTLIFSSFNVPEINSIFNKFCLNYMGKVKTTNPVVYGSIRQVFVQLPHVFHKFDATNVAACIDERFDFFIHKILPQQQDSLMKQTMIFVANYFDYVRLRNYFKREDISFVQICEYSKEAKVARARDMFFHGDAHFLLYTERFHFFNRIRIKGIRHLVFYQLPVFPHFYYEICNLMQEGYMNKKIGSMANMTVNVIYSKYDVQQLASIVGTERAIKMSQSDKNIHMLVTDAD